MALEKALFAMIAQLDRAERAFVTKSIGGEELRLFTLLTRKIKQTHAQVRAQFAHLSDASYATLRTRLKDSIAAAVGECLRIKLPEHSVQTAVYAADALMNKGEPELAQRFLGKSIKLAIEHQVFVHLPIMKGLRNRLPHFLVGNKAAAKKWPVIDQLLATLRQCELDFEASREWLAQAIELNRGEVLGRRVKIEQLQAKLPTMDRSTYSKTNLLCARSHWICAWFLGDMQAFAQLIDWTIGWRDNEISIWSDWETFDAVEAAYFLKAILLADKLEFQQALEILDQFEAKSRGVKRFYLPKLVEIRWYVRGRQILQGSDARAVKGELKALLKEFGRPQFIGDNLLNLFFWVINYSMTTKEFELAKPWLGHLTRARIESRRVERAIAGFMIELTFWYKAGDLEALDNCLRRLEYFAETRAADLSIVALVAQGFKGLSRAKPSPAGAINNFVLALDQYSDQEQLQIYLSMFDLRGHLMRHKEEE